MRKLRRRACHESKHADRDQDPGAEISLPCAIAFPGALREFRELILLGTSIDPNAPSIQLNAGHHRALATQLRERSAQAVLGGSSAARERHLSLGRLLPRERVDRLLDSGAPFLDIGAMGAYQMYEREPPDAGLITGIGRVCGKEVMIVANASTVKGGAHVPMTVKKHIRAQEIARENRLPGIHLVDSGGANPPHHADVFPDRHHFGRIFHNPANTPPKQSRRLPA
jgi:3-methylcrotonyl-CoA carboxylase beta subunit